MGLRDASASKKILLRQEMVMLFQIDGRVTQVICIFPIQGKRDIVITFFCFGKNLLLAPFTVHFLIV